MPRRAFLAALLIGVPLLVAATRLTGEPAAGFHGRGPGGFGLDGKTHQLRIEDDGTMLKIIVPLAGLQTGIGLRDKHMREKYLEVEKYPDAVLEVPWSAVKLPGDGRTVGAPPPGRWPCTARARTCRCGTASSVAATATRCRATSRSTSGTTTSRSRATSA